MVGAVVVLDDVLPAGFAVGVVVGAFIGAGDVPGALFDAGAGAALPAGLFGAGAVVDELFGVVVFAGALFAGGFCAGVVLAGVVFPAVLLVDVLVVLFAGAGLGFAAGWLFVLVFVLVVLVFVHGFDPVGGVVTVVEALFLSHSSNSLLN